MDTLLDDMYVWVDTGCGTADEDRMPSTGQLILEVNCFDRPPPGSVQPILNQHHPLTAAITMEKAVVYDAVDVHHRQVMLLSERTDCRFLQ
ncbi:hypothetical protein SKC39_22225 [Mycolicibacterium sp. 120322]